MKLKEEVIMKTWIAGWVAVLVMATGIPVMAADTSIVTAEGDLASTTYAVGNYSAVEVDSIQEKIARLRNEISKGTSVYTAGELKLLDTKLKETQNQLSVLTHGG